MSETLIIFTRYPEPGKTKTRLIPALGAIAAANLQKQLTEYTLEQAEQLQKIRAVVVKIYFTGGDRPLIQTWLGEQHIYQEQSSGDLGERMYQAFMKNPLSRTIIIGIDCPDLDVNLLETAFKALQNNNLVLGPATDGGYYLIGLQKPSQQLFDLFNNIPWSTDQVLAKTLAIAKKLDLSVQQLPTLNDIDTPADLHLWGKYQQQFENANYSGEV